MTFSLSFLCRFWSPARWWITVFLLCWTMPSMATKILLVGDSLSSGYGLEGAGWVELSNRQFVENDLDIQIINDSISGDTTAGGLARIVDGIDRIEPDWVVIGLGGNDGLRGVAPKVVEENLRRMIDITRSHGAEPMLLGIRVPPNYGRAYSEQFEQVFVNVSADTGTPLLPFFIGPLALDLAYMQWDNIHPNDAAQPLIRDRVVPFLLAVLSG